MEGRIPQAGAPGRIDIMCRWHVGPPRSTSVPIDATQEDPMNIQDWLTQLISCSSARVNSQ